MTVAAVRAWLWSGVLIVLASAAAARADPAPGAPPPAAEAAAGNSGPVTRFFRDGEWYASWGYSRDFWAPTDIHVSQPALGNNFTIHAVQGHDDPVAIFASGLSDLFGPQYNIRVGRFINPQRTIAIEFNFDHTKYNSTLGQTAQIDGVIGGAPVNGPFVLDDKIFDYALNNGANHVMFNVVYRQPLIGRVNESLSLAAIAKVGLGAMVPHTSNIVLGNPVDVGPKSLSNLIGFNHGWWQLGGWTVGTEFGLRATLLKPLYIEVTDKVAYADLTRVPVFDGALHHGLWLDEAIVSIGLTFDGTHRRRR
ncbi:MAG TPA: hypothetical protein VGL58_04575 [Caulobacteraceae bacterium]|jgi:hypothetical protein